MAHINISFLGRIGQSPALRFTQSGTAVSEVRVAVNRRERNRNGEWADAPATWLNVVTFNNLAQEVAEKWAKGDEVYVTGELITEEWTDRESGEVRQAQKVRADRVERPQYARRTSTNGTEQQEGDAVGNGQEGSDQ